MSARTHVLEFVLGVRRRNHRPDPLGDAVALSQSKVAAEFQAAADRVAAIIAAPPEEVAGLATRLRSTASEAEAPTTLAERLVRDPLQRHLLCQATGLHDPRPDGTCRDCEAVVTDPDRCCRSEP